MVESVRLQNKYRELERLEPFPKKYDNMNPKEKSFIRDIQITHKLNLEDAISVSENYNIKGKKEYKKLEKKVQKRLKEYYDKDKNKIATRGEFKKPKVKQEKTDSIYVKSKKGKKRFRKYNPKTLKRVAKALEKYPDASNYELRHGVNSKASQQYRLKHGLNKNYEGRVIIKKKE